MAGVVVYKTQRCGFCVNAIRYLQERKGVEVESIDLSYDQGARIALIERTGSRTVPQIFIGETHIGGYSELVALDQSGGLDPLLQALLESTDQA